MVKPIFIHFMLLMLLSLSVSAKRLESIGISFQIDEPDLLIAISQHLQQMDKAGLIETQQQQFKDQVKKSMQRPKPYFLPTTTQSTTFYFDPSITATKDIKDAQGHIIIKSGTKVNPLDRVSLSKTLLFLNADEPFQVCWLQRQLANDADAKIILIQGDIFRISEQLNSSLYFDQGGSLSKKLQLTHVPARITQADQQLKITEALPCAS